MGVVDKTALFQWAVHPKGPGEFQIEMLAASREAYVGGVWVTLEHVVEPQLGHGHVVALDRVLPVLQLQGMPARQRARR